MTTPVEIMNVNADEVLALLKARSREVPPGNGTPTQWGIKTLALLVAKAALSATEGDKARAEDAIVALAATAQDCLEHLDYRRGN